MDTAHPPQSRTMLDKIWAEHVVVPNADGEELMFVDLNLVHEGGTFMAFDQLPAEGRKVRICSPATKTVRRQRASGSSRHTFSNRMPADTAPTSSATTAAADRSVRSSSSASSS